MKIVIVGGTGLIGSKTVPILRQGGHEVVAASPNTGVNSITGEGLKQAAQNLADVMPTVLTIATQIVATITRLTG